MSIFKSLTFAIIILVSAAMMIIAETAPPGIQKRAAPGEGIYSGTVIAFGKIVAPPYYITIDNNRVLINGLAFYPRERRPATQYTRIKASPLDTQKYNVIKNIKARYLEYYTKYDQTIIQELLKEEFLKYSIVSSITLKGNDIRLEFSDLDYESLDLTSYLNAGQGKTRPATEMIRELNDEAANAVSCLGNYGMISFGYEYTTYFPRNLADSINDIIDKLSGAKLDSATAVDQLMNISGRREFIDDIANNFIIHN